MGATTGERGLRAPGYRGRGAGGGVMHEGSGSECLAEVMRLLSSCVGRIGPAGGPLGEAGAECCMEQFRASVHLLLARHLGQDCGLAAGAYDLGLATGFYGRDAAVTVGLGSRYGAQLERACAQGVGAHGVLNAGLMRQGYLHGRAMRGWAQDI